MPALLILRWIHCTKELILVKNAESIISDSDPEGRQTPAIHGSRGGCIVVQDLESAVDKKVDKILQALWRPQLVDTKIDEKMEVLFFLLNET